MGVFAVQTERLSGRVDETVPIPIHAHRFLRESDRMHGCLSERVENLAKRTIESIARSEALNEAYLMCPAAIDACTCEDQFCRSAATDEWFESGERPSARNDAEPHLRQAPDRFRGAQADIACQGELEATP